MQKRHLQIWVDEEEGPPQVDPADLPTPDEVLYQAPNSDTTRKACGNCIMFGTKDRSCTIHASEVDIDPLQICGYYVFGPPMETRIDHPGMDSVTPDLSGLMETSIGSSCDICVHYSFDETCHAVQQDGRYAKVDPLGCCTRWYPHLDDDNPGNPY
ncbi:hypothetical protein LCGC14_0414620 [marine sediment metagenome]|uniref:Uncharacterized protein n=1 Tax=marine sediment metagenome TaxID=412755 RepID=A0A0F9TAQ6_9ZZZZ